MREITGRHVLIFTVSAFGVIIAVNLVMAWQAISTFPGLEVQNSYVASQSFDKRRAEQEALGWRVAQTYDAAQGRMALTLEDAAGNPAPVADLTVLIGRTTESKEDQRPVFVRQGAQWQADVQLGIGKWLLKINAVAEDGTLFEQRLDFFVKG